ncbi:MAG: hypothetical protein MZV70_76670 [Desulfobacterales bacterium]|nr:hypothetical protein [Desulfobacterales bacterium]
MLHSGACNKSRILKELIKIIKTRRQGIEITNSEDIYNYLQWDYTDISAQKNETLKLDLLDNEKKVCEILSLEPVSFDEVFKKVKVECSRTYGYNDIFRVIRYSKTNAGAKTLC